MAMEQFNKWLLTDEGQILVGDHRAKAAWKAALEWALSLKEGMGGSEVINPEDIEEELSDA